MLELPHDAKKAMTRRKQSISEKNGATPGIADDAQAGLSDKAVADYLLDHPDFLINHGELLRVLTPPSKVSGENVVDMQTFMIDRLRADNGRLISTTRGNLSGQARIHDAVLAMLGATSFEELVHIASTDLAILLDLDAVVLGVESADEDAAGKHPGGVCVLAPGAVERLVGKGRDVRLKISDEGEESVFGAATGLVRSQAMIRLNFSDNTPPGLLALGSRDCDKFQNGQGTELLLFLARVLEHCVRAWLYLTD